MIDCAMTELTALLGQSDDLDTAIRYLQREDWRALPHGQTEIDGTRVYINRFAYETSPAADEPFETHQRYMDIHLLLTGRERVSAANPAVLQEIKRDDAEDYVLATGFAEQTAALYPGHALLIPPGEAHRTREALDGPCTVEKAVCKVKWAPCTRLTKQDTIETLTAPTETPAENAHEPR